MNTIKLTKENVLSLIGRYASASRYCPTGDGSQLPIRKTVEQAIDTLFAALEEYANPIDALAPLPGGLGSESTEAIADGDKAINSELRPNALDDARRAEVFVSIETERIYQELKWGTLEEHPQSVGAYLTLMRVHLADAEAAWARSNGNTAALDRLRRVLAIGVACGEQHGIPKRDYSSVNYGDG